MIECVCGKCGKQLKVPDQLAGRKLECPVCKKTIPVPAAPERPPGPPVPGFSNSGDGAIKVFLVILLLVGGFALVLFRDRLHKENAGGGCGAFGIEYLFWLLAGLGFAVIGVVWKRRK